EDGPKTAFKDPATSAILINDALETGRLADIPEALSRMRSGEGPTVRSIRPGEAIHLAEVLETLERSGLRLVAIPRAEKRSAATCGG
ncbi:MAG: hypothetical protein AAF677_10010, partial [Pseudomonadota bacterium]